MNLSRGEENKIIAKSALGDSASEIASDMGLDEREVKQFVENNRGLIDSTKDNLRSDRQWQK